MTSDAKGEENLFPSISLKRGERRLREKREKDLERKTERALKRLLCSFSFFNVYLRFNHAIPSLSSPAMHVLLLFGCRVCLLHRYIWRRSRWSHSFCVTCFSLSFSLISFLVPSLVSLLPVPSFSSHSPLLSSSLSFCASHSKPALVLR